MVTVGRIRLMFGREMRDRTAIYGDMVVGKEEVRKGSPMLSSG